MPIRLLCTFAIAVAVSFCAEISQPIASKHTWSYEVEWRLVRAGTATMTWTPEANGFQSDLHVESTGLVSKLYGVKDDYRARMNGQLCASTVNIHAEEGKRRRDTSITFSQGKASYSERDLLKNNAVVLAKETPIPDCTHEYIGALQRLRFYRPELGQSLQIPVSNGKKASPVKVDAQEREDVTTPLGKFKTIRYEIFMFNDVIISKKARMYVWITDDDRRLPVQIRVRMPFLIGTIDLKLEKME